MYNVMIVDDEPLIRRGLKETIDWDLLGLQVSFEAKNGKEAFAHMPKIKPHIIITDMKMPIMDGIELIKNIRQSGDSTTRIIVLSGYNEFEYLKEAITYNVESYLLKPINHDELILTLQSAIINIEKDISIEYQNKQGLKALENNIMNRLITNAISTAEFFEKCNQFGIRVLNTKYKVLILEILYVKDDAKQGSGQGQGFGKTGKQFDILHLCEKTLGTTSRAIFLSVEGKLIILFRASDDEVITKIQEIILELDSILGIVAVAYIGHVENIGEIHKSYYNALEFIESKFLGSEKRVIDCADIKYTDENVSSIDFDVIETYLLRGDITSITDYFHSHILSLQNASIDYVQTLIIDSILKIIGLLKDKNVHINKNIANYSQVMRIHHFDLMIKYLDDFLQNVMLEIPKTNKTIQEVISYAKKNYFKDITLKELSIKFDINTSYLGQLFKKETGLSFAEFINQYRIKEAVAYIENSTMKIYEISEEVGFTNYQYFVKIFKKYTGKTPSDFK